MICCQHCANTLFAFVVVVVVASTILNTTTYIAAKLIVNNEGQYVDNLTLSRAEFENKPNGESITACQAGWLPLRSDPSSPFTHCIKIIMTFRMTWQQAEESCTHLSGAHLISIHDAEDIQKIPTAINLESNLAVSSSWVGRLYKKTPNCGWWIGLGQLCPNENVKEMPKMRWTDGTIDGNRGNATTIGGLEIKIPKTDDWSKQYCISYHYEKTTKGKGFVQYFNMSECTERRNFICKIPALSQQQSEAGFVLSEAETEESEKLLEEKTNEMNEEFPCGKDPLYCPRKDENGEVTCYHLLTKSYYWNQAIEACEAEYDSDLVSIHSKDESNFIYQMATMQPSVSGETKYWIGLHRRNAEKQYLWSDGSPLNYMELRTSEENDEEGNERGACNVVKMKVSPHSLFSSALYDKLSVQTQPSNNEPEYSWVHQRCDNKRLGICQKAGFGIKGARKTTKKEQQKSDLVPWKCSDYYELFRGMCYKVYGGMEGKIKTFDEAKTACENEKSTLVSLTDPYEQGFVLTLLRGLDTNAWIGMDMTAGRVRWLDAEPVEMTRFTPDTRIMRIGNDKHVFQSAHSVGFYQDACVSLDATTMIGYWDLTFNMSEPLQPGEKSAPSNGQCNSKKLPYVCEKYAEQTDDTIKVKPCYSIGNITYCLLWNADDKELRRPYSFNEGRHVCDALPLHPSYNMVSSRFGGLPVVDDLFEWSFLTAIALDNGYEQFYMGIRFNETSGFVRTDGRRIRLTPWGDGEPNLKNGECVMTKLNREGPAWFMVPCSKRTPAICRLTKAPPKAEPEPSVRCPKGKEDWILGSTHCYRLVPNTSMISTGYKADHDCFKIYNANLASFETEEDFSEFRKHIIHDSLAVSYAFIGLIKRNEEAFAWKDLSPVTFLNWDEGEPTNLFRRDGEDCVQMKLRDNFAWQTVNCWQNRHFICSVPVVEKEQSQKADPNATDNNNDKNKANDKASKDARKGEDGNVKKGDDGKASDKDKSDNEKKSSDEGNAKKANSKATDSSKGDGKSGKDSDSNEKPKAKVVNIDGKEKQNSPSEDGVHWGRVIAATMGFMLAATVVILYIRYRNRSLLRNREQQIMQFDALQNEEDYGL